MATNVSVMTNPDSVMWYDHEPAPGFLGTFQCIMSKYTLPLLPSLMTVLHTSTLFSVIAQIFLTYCLHDCRKHIKNQHHFVFLLQMNVFKSCLCVSHGGKYNIQTNTLNGTPPSLQHIRAMGGISLCKNLIILGRFHAESIFPGQLQGKDSTVQSLIWAIEFESAMSNVPTIQLNDGHLMPSVGLGTWLVSVMRLDGTHLGYF